MTRTMRHQNTLIQQLRWSPSLPILKSNPRAPEFHPGPPTRSAASYILRSPALTAAVQLAACAAAETMARKREPTAA